MSATPSEGQQALDLLRRIAEALERNNETIERQHRPLFIVDKQHAASLESALREMKPGGVLGAKEKTK